MKKIRIPFPNWKELSKDTVDFYFQEAEKELKESMNTFSRNKQRAFDLLKMLFPVISLTVGYILTNVEDEGKMIPAITFLLTNVIGSVLLLLAVKPRDIFATGSLPSKLINSKSINGLGEKEQYIGVILNYCENLEPRILANHNENKKIADLLVSAIVIVGAVSPLLFLAALFF